MGCWDLSASTSIWTSLSTWGDWERFIPGRACWSITGLKGITGMFKFPLGHWYFTLMYCYINFQGVQWLFKSEWPQPNSGWGMGKIAPAYKDKCFSIGYNLSRDYYLGSCNREQVKFTLLCGVIGCFGKHPTVSHHEHSAAKIGRPTSLTQTTYDTEFTPLWCLVPGFWGDNHPDNVSLLQGFRDGFHIFNTSDFSDYVQMSNYKSPTCSEDHWGNTWRAVHCNCWAPSAG